MIDHKTLDQYIATLEDMLLFLREFRNRRREDALSGDYLLELHHLKEILKSRAWPEAVPKDSICDPNSDDDKKLRAEIIISDLANLEAMNFLDYHCGEGYVAAEAAKKAKKAVGYDPAGLFVTHSRGNLYLTQSQEEMKTQGPYDVVLLYDVLDHCDHPVEVLKTIKELKKGNGPVYVRCHPWTSRHATHLYHDINKAFMHLIFTYKELLTIGVKGKKTAKLLNPMETYGKWFKEAGLKVEMERTIRTPAEEFFNMDVIVAKRLKEQWPGAIPDLSIEFVDFVLS